MTAKHTEGPWSIRHYKTILGNTVIDAVVDPNGYKIATSGLALTSGEEADANARLIAAAPDLLLATQMLLDVLDELSAECEAVDEFQAPIRIARAAVSKATGEPNNE